jgi:hypothetical protein
MKVKLSKLDRNRDRYSETQRWLKLDERSRRLEYNIKNPNQALKELEQVCRNFGLDLYGNPL